MNQRLEALKKRVRDGEHRSVRQTAPIDVVAECEAEGLSWPRRVGRLVHRLCEAEHVTIDPDERIAFTRTIPVMPPIYSAEDWARMTAGRALHELGPISNICADWSLLLTQGLLGRRQVALQSRERLVTVREGATIDDGKALMHRHKLERVLVVNDAFELRGLMTVKDITKQTDFPSAARDGHGKLRVGAAVGVGEGTEERVAALVAQLPAAPQSFDVPPTHVKGSGTAETA